MSLKSMNLHPIEKRVLRGFVRLLQEATEGNAKATEFSEEEVISSSGLDDASFRRGVEWLVTRGYLKIKEERIDTRVFLTEMGHLYLEKGLPEERALSYIEGYGEMGCAPSELNKILKDEEEPRRVVGNLIKEGMVKVVDGRLFQTNKGVKGSYIEKIRNLLLLVDGSENGISLQSIASEDRETIERYRKRRGKERGLFRVREDRKRVLLLTEEGLKVAVLLEKEPDEADVSSLTPQLLKDGAWRNVVFRRYNLSIPPPYTPWGRKHYYREFLDYVTKKLIRLGFKEMRGPIVETEFWNMDALFMPQFHPSRQIHDVYYVDAPSSAPSGIEAELISKVAQVHENGNGTGSRGWRYRFDVKRSFSLILRSQGTSLSARTLASKPDIPGKYFAIARCFRYDTVDATHAPDFFQVEGIVVSEKVNMRTLLGLLGLFAEEIAGAKEIKFYPAYFPFTEPSVEVHMRHPAIGWMELGGAGIFRPEVTIPLGVQTPVLAWGLGLDRMAMVYMGIEDIRDLFSSDLGFIRRKRFPLLEI